jgi:hypothetical protein
MNNRFFIPIMMISLIILISVGYPLQTAGEEKKDKNIRNSILAGSWYPGNKKTLSRTVEGFLSKVKIELLEGQLTAFIVPHAGYMYSGQVAAYAYRLLQDMDFKRVIMVGPSHRARFKGASINLQSGYKTPLGIVPVDQDLAKKIIDTSDQIRWVPQAHVREHSLEIQLPFLQTVLSDFQIVPILMGEQDFKTCSDLADSLLQVTGTMGNTLLLASSDLSHFHTYKRARELDMRFINHVREFDPSGLASSLSTGSCEACGGGPSITVMLAAQRLGANRTLILKYANSGDVTGDHSRVVGYLSAALIRGN